MLFTLQDLPNGFGPAVERWLARAEVLDPVYQLYLGPCTTPRLFLAQRFLDLAQALEAYHMRSTLRSPSGDARLPRRGVPSSVGSPDSPTGDAMGAAPYGKRYLEQSALRF